MYHGSAVADGSLPVATAAWSAQGVDLRVTAFAHAGQAMVEYRVANQTGKTHDGTLVLVERPVQINPHWQHGGHANIHAIAMDDSVMSVNDVVYAALSKEPSATSIADFDEGDVTRLIEKAPYPTPGSLRSVSGLLSAACEFAFSLAPAPPSR